jgi:hypothetical protein
MIYITNKSDKVWRDRHAGVDYEFPINKTVEIPEAAALHIFGYGDSNKEPYLARLGWCKSTNELPDALERLGKWDFSIDPPKQNQSLSPLVEQVPLPVNKRAGERSSRWLHNMDFKWQHFRLILQKSEGCCMMRMEISTPISS